MTVTYSRAVTLVAMLLVAMFAACTSFGPSTDEGPADTVLDSIGDDGGVVDVVDPVDGQVDGKVPDAGRDTIPDDGGSEVGIDAEPDARPDVEPELPPDDTKEVEQPLDDGPESDVCVPECGEPGTENERVCGPDGCGDVCGYCGYGFACNISDGKCIEICIPDCLTEGKVCGDDGCNGSCGECGVNYKCGPDFKCYPDVCESDCVEKGYECGLDRCGNSCGLCGESEVCSVGGKCAPGACYGVDKERHTCSLDGRYQYQCIVSGETESLLKIDCYAMTGAQCGTRGCDCHYNAYSGFNECIEKEPCVPKCEGKECGEDGCGGLCITDQTNSSGFCKGGWRCGVDSRCRPMAGADCLWIDWMGTCWSDNWLYTCSSDMVGQGEIMAENCTTSGKTCYFNTSGMQYICGSL